MKIISLHAENVKRLRAVDITPSDSTVVIAGRNSQGKTSVLDSILLALAGKDAAKLMTRPIRDGAERAEVTLELGDYTVARTWTANDKSYLSVKARGGEKVQSPQAVLDELVGNLSLDPLAFTRMSARQQRDALLRIVPLKVNLDEWEAGYKTVFDERTAVGRDVTQLEGQLAGMPPIVTDTDAEVSLTELLGQIQEREKKNDDYRRKEMEITRSRERIADLERQLAYAREELAKQEGEIEGMNWMNTDAMRAQLAQAEESNRRVRAKKERDAVERRVAEAKARYAELTAVLENAQKNKADALANAAMPIEGLSVDDQGVTYRGVPFGQLSAAEQLKVSLAIAMAMNPTLRVIRILDGSLLDEGNMKVIREMAREKDFQVWVERVQADEGGPCIVIEDGVIASQTRP